MRQLRKEFEARGPWVTCFDVGGTVLGGGYHAAVDGRLKEFLARLPRPGRVLELGCLEGGHSFPLARVAEHVVALDARRRNLERARWLQGVLGQSNITFLEANVEDYDFTGLGTFDAVFNVGLLYHLPEPWVLLERLAPITIAMYLWTHVAPDHEADSERGGYVGKCYQEHGLRDPLSGMSAMSFWPTLGELRRMLAAAGFGECELIGQDANHRHGPAVSLFCMTAPQ